MGDRLRFGIFMAPFHAPGTNPTLALHRDLELIEHLDRLGYDEAWIGEHHSAGSEIIASPEIFIATAAERTRHIRLGTGVVSLSYHNPLWVAERIVLLDHLTRGRVMLGVGPGALPTDAAMIGVQQSQTRELLEQSFDVIMRLLTSEEPVTFKNDRWDLREARLHLRPYSDPLFDVAVAAVASPSGPRLAGRHGVGLLSIGATSAAGFDALALHWGVMEEVAARHGRTVDRSKWRLVGLVHCAETEEQAYRDVEYGIEQWFRYFQAVAAFPQMSVPGDSVREMIAFVNEFGLRRHRHARDGGGADRAAGRPVERRLRRLPDAGARVGEPGGDAAQLRPGRARRDAALPGPGEGDARRRRPGAGGADGAGGPAEPGGRGDAGEVPGRGGRRALAQQLEPVRRGEGRRAAGGEAQAVGERVA